MRVAEIMTPRPRCISPRRTLREAARMMDELDVGALPVCLDGELVGILTDRDIVVRATSAGADPNRTIVGAVMTDDPRWCHPDDDIDSVLDTMSAVQIRRMPVVDDRWRVIGIVTLGDLAADHVGDTGEALSRISTPAEPDRSASRRERHRSALTDEERAELERRHRRSERHELRGRVLQDDRRRSSRFEDEEDRRAGFGLPGSGQYSGEVGYDEGVPGFADEGEARGLRTVSVRPPRHYRHRDVLSGEDRREEDTGRRDRPRWG
jgi:CBS domain-containing protein